MGSTGGASPSELVTEAIASGVASRAGLAERTGLNPGTIDLILDRLERTGALQREQLSGCAEGGCGSCAHNDACSGPSAVGGPGRGPVLLTLTRNRPR